MARTATAKRPKAAEVAETIPELAPPVPAGIFDNDVDLWTFYRCKIAFRNRIIGATPRNPKVIQQWIRANAGTTTEEEIRARIVKTMAETGTEVDETLSFEDLVGASERVAHDQSNGFKRHPDHGLYMEGRIVKAMLRESVNILYAGERWGLTSKGPKSYMVERVFVVEDVIPLGRKEPDGMELMFGHVQTPQGPRSTVGLSEFIFQPTATFHIMVQNIQARTKAQRESEKKQRDEGKEPAARLAITDDLWQTIWVQSQEIGLGALRSQGHGRFNVVEWKQVPKSEVPKLGADATKTMGIVLETAPEPPSPPSDESEGGKASGNGATP